MLPQHRHLVTLGGRSRGAMASFLSMSSHSVEEGTAPMSEEETSKVDVSSSTTRQDRTWNSTQGISFADAKAKTWNPLNGIRFSGGPSPPFPGGDEARRLSSSTRARAAETFRKDPTDNAGQIEPKLGRDSKVVGVSGTEVTYTDKLRHGDLDSPRPVARPSQDLQPRPAGQASSMPIDRKMSNSASSTRAVTRSGESSGPVPPPAAIQPGKLLDQPTKSPVQTSPRIKFGGNRPNPFIVDGGKLLGMSGSCVETEMSDNLGLLSKQSLRALPHNDIPQTKQRSESPLPVSGFVKVRPDQLAYLSSDAMRIQGFQHSLLNVILKIDRLLREDIALPKLKLKLRDLQNDVYLCRDEVEGKIHHYRITLAKIDDLKLLGKWSKWSSFYPRFVKQKDAFMPTSYKDKEKVILHLYLRILRSLSSLWRAIRSLVTFRETFIYVQGTRVGRRIGQVLARFEYLSDVLTNDLLFRQAYTNARNRFNSQYPNADARAPASRSVVARYEILSKLKNLRDFWLRNGLVTIEGSSQSQTGRWRRTMLHSMKSLLGPSELHHMIRPFELSSLYDSQSPDPNQNIRINNQVYADLASECRLLYRPKTSNLLQKLRRGWELAQYFEDIIAEKPRIDIRMDVLRMIDESNPGQAEPSTKIAQASPKRRLVRTSEARDTETFFYGTTGLSSSGSLRFQSSPRLTYPDLSTSKYLGEREPLYPIIDGPCFVDNRASCGTNESGESILEDNRESSAPSYDPPFCTPLGFHIPKARLQRAIDTEPSRMGAYWQYTLYQGPGGEKDKVKVHYCKSKDSAERISQLFLQEEVIGFDIEWKMNATATDGVKKNVALMQVASETRIALFHIARYPNAVNVDDFVAPTFKRIMESPKITKVGVSIKGDCTRLKKFMDVESRGIFELSHLYKLVKYSSGDIKKINKVMVNLAQQVEEHLQLPLWKGEVRSSDWSQDLNYQQIQYAASDSYAGFQLFHILEAKRKALNPTPPRPAHAELDLPIQLANGRTVVTYEGTPENIDEPSIDSGPDTPISIEELARDFLNLEVEELSPKVDPANGPIKKATKGPPKSPSSSESQPASLPSSTPPKPLHPSVIEANTWLTNYANNLPTSRPPIAKPADLRAYHLWYHQELDIHEIASRLRDPPLAISTVAGYVLRAIQAEHLPYYKKRIWALVPEVHKTFRGVYKGMIMQRNREQDSAAEEKRVSGEEA